jgi:hypothetical protein
MSSVMGVSRRHPVFALAVITCGLPGCTAGLFSEHAAQAPDYALKSMLIYRFEIGLLVFTGLYLALIVVRPAYHGHTLTRIGAGG